MSENITKCPFKPLQCTDKVFQDLAAIEGYVYFVTDKKKIYLAKDGEKIPMCSSSGFFYGQKEIHYDNDGNLPPAEVIFSMSEIEGEDIPEINDLILNIDGCFYRVRAVADSGIQTVRLTLQGTGGGIGGGGGPGSGETGDTTVFSVEILDGKTKVYASESPTMPISLRCNYYGEKINAIDSIVFKRDIDREAFYTIQDQPFNEILTFDLKGYENLFGNTPVNVTIYLYDNYGTERSVTIKVQKVSLTLTAGDAVAAIISTNQPSYSYTATLQTANTTTAVTERKIIYQFFAENNPYVAKLTQEQNIRDIGNSGEVTITQNLNLAALETHGVYDLKVWVQTKFAGSGNILTSNVLKHKVAYTTGEQTLLVAQGPSTAIQYGRIELNYLVWDKIPNKAYTLNISVDGRRYTSLDVKAGIPGAYSMYFDDIGTYVVEIAIAELSNRSTFTIDVNPYSSSGSNLPIINPTRNDLMLYLTPKSKSNDAPDKEQWADYSGRYTGEIADLFYNANSGWITNKEQVPCLKLISGGKFTIPGFKPFQHDPTIPHGEDSRMGNGMTIELDFEVNGVLDPTAPLIQCLSADKQAGFRITGETIDFYGSNTDNEPLLTLNIIEGQRIRVSFTLEARQGRQFPLLCGYLNGKLSGVKSFSGIGFIDENAIFTANATHAQINIYGIRFYHTVLSDEELINNYIASLSDLQEQQQSAMSNRVYAGGLVDYKAVVANKANIEIPYMVLTGGYPTTMSSDKKVWTVTDQDTGLPMGKKDYKLVDVEVYYPSSFHDKGYEDYKCITKLNNNQSIMGNIVNANSTVTEGGAVMYAQGTSSMIYPVKNLRLRFKDKDKQIKVRPDLASSKIICMKADFMESSGSHNTGAANLIDALYSSCNMQTPGQAHFKTEDNDIVTCIKGYPCLIFYSSGKPDSNYEYIGKYNLNLDKATPEQFGFDHDDTTGFGYEDNDLIRKQNSVYCFEFLDNGVKVCNFQNKDKSTTYEDTWYAPIEAGGKAGWTLGFESRYPEDADGDHDADALYPLAAWVNELDGIRSTNEALALARFKNEYQCYFNKEFLLTYYLITEALLMVDSRVKNMMIATWGKENNKESSDSPCSYYPLKEVTTNENTAYQPDTTQPKVITNNYIFYPIFYDMDTMLGLDNVGAYRFKYYNEDTQAGVYNGAGVLWSFVRDALSLELRQQFQKLENGNTSLKATSILPYFNKDQANLANEAFYNGDARYKYVNPFVNGYVYDSKSDPVPPGEANFLYAAQGDRSLLRTWFVNNRMKFLSGKYTSNEFISKNKIDFRFNSHDTSKEELNFEFKTLREGYVGVQIGLNGPVYAKRCSPDKTVTITVPNSSYTGTEAAILGVSNISDLGDLSDKQIQNWSTANADELRLATLKLGSSAKGYSNEFWATGAGVSLENALYLKQFEFQNCASYKNEFNFTACPSIESIFLTGSTGITGVKLPENGSLKELRLPPLSTLIINSHRGLLAEKFSMGEYKYNDNADSGSEPIGYIEDFSKLTRLEIINTPIDTHHIVREASNLKTYLLQNVNWIIGEDDVDNEAKRITKIQALDFLGGLVNSDGMVGATPSSEALTGTLTIRISDSDWTVNEFDIYNKYHSIFPNLVIKYEGVEPIVAPRIEFYPDTKESDPTVPYFTALISETNSTSTLADLIRDDRFTNPFKNADTNNEYIFNGLWEEGDTDIIYSQNDEVEEGQKTFKETVPNKSMKLYPIFTVKERTHTIQFYDYNYEPGNATNTGHLFDISGKYNTSIQDAINVPQVKYNYRPVLNDDGFADTERWGFKGWISESDFAEWRINHTKIVVPIDFTDMKFTHDFKVFAYYEKEDAALVATSLDCFDVVSGSYLTVRGENVSGTYIRVKPEYVDKLGGKITIPSKDANGKAITMLGSLKSPQQAGKGESKITDIYFLENSQYTIVGDQSCTGMSSLCNVYLPKSITTIGNQAFSRMANLTHVTLPTTVQYIGQEAFQSTGINLSTLPAALETIGARAFNSCPNVSITSLPNSLREIGDQCFMSSGKVVVDQFGGENSALTSIGRSAFAYCDSRGVAMTVTIERNKDKAPIVFVKKSILGQDPARATFANGYGGVAFVTVKSEAISLEEGEILEIVVNDLFGRNVTLSQEL